MRPEKRRKGYGARLLHQVSEQLWQESAVLCFLANEKKTWEQSLYLKAGYIATSQFGVIFCDREKTCW